MTQRSNGLGDVPPLTQSSYRQAVASIIRSVQAKHEESDRDTADRLGCSRGTIENARNGRGDLNAVTLLKIGDVYGLDAMGPAVLLIGGKVAPTEAVCTSDREMPVHVAGAQVFLCRALSDNNRIDDHEVVDGAEAIEAGGQVFDTLRWRLNGLRVRGWTA